MHRSSAPVISALLLCCAVSCEVYELPPRVRGVPTESCPQCEVLDLSESRVEPGAISIDARFMFEDEWGAVESLRVFVTDPSGRPVVVEKDPWLDCQFASSLGDASDIALAGACRVTSSRADTQSGDDDAAVGASGGEGSLRGPLDGVQQAPLTARFGVLAEERGEWTVQVEVERATGMRSNRLSATFDVVADQ